MDKVIYYFKSDAGEIVVMQEYHSPPYSDLPKVKTWKGTYFIDEEPTNAKIKKIMSKSPFEIKSIFPDHEGKAFVESVTKTRPMCVKFVGSAFLKENGIEIAKKEDKQKT